MSLAPTPRLLIWEQRKTLTIGNDYDIVPTLAM